jgi:hypothetical protein
MTDFDSLLATLARHQVASILVGGAAAIAHGSARLTQDLDIVYQRNTANLKRLVEALTHHKPYLRGAPPGLPFAWDLATLARGLNFTLTTSLGDIDLLGGIPGRCTYEDLLSVASFFQICGSAPCGLLPEIGFVSQKRPAVR